MSNLHKELIQATIYKVNALVDYNICNDMHTCTVTAGDNWLQSWLPMILNSRAYTSGTTAVMVVWDEDTAMPNLWIAPSIASGMTIGMSGHYALLRATEEMLGMPYLLGNANSAPDMRPQLNL